MRPSSSRSAHRTPTASGKPSNRARNSAAPCSPSTSTSFGSSPHGSGSVVWSVADTGRRIGTRLEPRGTARLAANRRPRRRPTERRLAARPPPGRDGPARCSVSQRLATRGRPMNLDLQALETSFDLIAPRGDELMDEFYSRLFEAAPAVMPLFANTDLKRQKTMLLGTLVLLRKSLRDLDAIVPKLRDLGARHVAYGAQPDHYPVVGQALLGAMAAVAGSAWRPEYESAWTEAFGVVAGAMLEGAAAASLEDAA